MQLGAHVLRNTVFLAPMAGITDRPFRRIARRYGAGLAVSEMVSARPELRETRKSLLRIDHAGEAGPVSVQIAGADPAMLADAARHNVERGAQVIDINMGCPAKKVCNVHAGSALLGDEGLVARILEAVVAAVDVPVTLKIRTGPSPDRRNAARIARIAEGSGIRMLAIHGRTRECAFRGEAEYATIADVKSRVRIPVIANGDIAGPEDALRVLRATGADGVMIGRAAQGQPWVIGAIARFLATGERAGPPSIAEMRAVVVEHLECLYAFYGEEAGSRIARKHIGWYSERLPGGTAFRAVAMRIGSARGQLAAVDAFYAQAGADDFRTAGDPREKLAA
ncbi:MAG: tRNA dihydrouridine synthase DusB [Betaproteobacteria bacterium]|nr:tRNA dihydrouridine synthase DusB [Betaproteobacteria bacterium]